MIFFMSNFEQDWTLSNMISHYQDGSIEFYQFDNAVLSSFGINTEEQLKQISEKLQKAFNAEQE